MDFFIHYKLGSLNSLEVMNAGNFMTPSGFLSVLSVKDGDHCPSEITRYVEIIRLQTSVKTNIHIGLEIILNGVKIGLKSN